MANSIPCQFVARHATRSPERNRQVDLALAVMCRLQQPGERVPHRIIAEVTGLAHSGVAAIERRALVKLRQRLTYTIERHFGAECRQRA